MVNNAEEDTLSEDCYSEIGEGAATFLENMTVKSKIDEKLLEGISQKYPTAGATTRGMSGSENDTMRALLPDEDCKFGSGMDD